MKSRTGPQCCAFISYAHRDDASDFNQVRKLAKGLENEVTILEGTDGYFTIWLDENGIGWGDQWKRRIDEGLGGSTFLIPFITPRFFRRDECIREVRRFQEEETKRGRNDLILPIMYVRTDLKQLSQDQSLSEDARAAAGMLSSRQYEDWTSIRIEDVSSSLSRKQLHLAASKLRVAVSRSKSLDQPGESTRNANTLVVAPGETGHCRTISDAILKASPGSRILVREGRYREQIVIPHPITIQPASEHEGPVVIEAESPVVLCNGTSCSLINLHCITESKSQEATVVVRSGQAGLSRCRVEGPAHAGVLVQTGARADIENCRILRSAGYGLSVGEHGKAECVASDISHHPFAGVCGSMNSTIVIRDSTISNNSHGAFLYFQGDWDIDPSQYSDNRLGDVSLSNLAKPPSF